jgi:hypothetical protein
MIDLNYLNQACHQRAFGRANPVPQPRISLSRWDIRAVFLSFGTVANA